VEKSVLDLVVATVIEKSLAQIVAESNAWIPAANA